MFRKILIANRGEICCRIAATATRLGIRTVAIFSDSDRKAKHTSVCDEAVSIGGTTASESYLSIAAVLEAARATGVEAIHPGYGFLAENPEFAEACVGAGFIFIGPPADIIRAMGDKGAAKTVMENAGIPVIPGYHGNNQEPSYLGRQAATIGYPVLLKARAGGGGKGMRRVDDPEEFVNALSACRREAKSSFGDESVLIEKYLSPSRHIEVQVFADTHGNYLHLFERDCSVQRRHQKILEEAPAPGVTESQRGLITETAVSAARAVNYINAGTVEFILDTAGQFYFMEMNTRLQVEHPVTEMITGQDLVEWQLRVAAGLPLPLQQNELTVRGHAVEGRVYAEKPGHDFLPSTGTMRVLRSPPAIHFSTPMSPPTSVIRLDSGINEGDTVTPYYDPLLAKLIAWDKDRAGALRQLRNALDDFVVLGLQTNAGLLGRVLRTPDFSSGNLDTGLIARNESFLLKWEPVIGSTWLALAAAALLKIEEERIVADKQDPYSPWACVSGWRLNLNYARILSWATAQGTLDAALIYPLPGSGKSTYQLETGGRAIEFEILEYGDDRLAILVGGRRINSRIFIHQNTYDLFANGEQITLTLIDPLAHASQLEHGETQLTAPMPGKIVSVLVKKNETVPKGTPLIIMEAMKMEHTIVALTDGRVDELLVNVADQVSEGTELLLFTPTETTNETEPRMNTNETRIKEQ